MRATNIDLILDRVLLGNSTYWRLTFNKCGVGREFFSELFDFSFWPLTLVGMYRLEDGLHKVDKGKGSKNSDCQEKFETDFAPIELLKICGKVVEESDDCPYC